VHHVTSPLYIAPDDMERDPHARRLGAGNGTLPKDQGGNTALAQYLWGYNFWTRAQQLRELTRYFRSIGVDNQERLKQWALTSPDPLDQPSIAERPLRRARRSQT
jgi:hypothetical protein